MSETSNNICIINAQSGIGTSSPQISRFTHNFDCIKFVIDKDFSEYATVIITSVNNNINIISEGEFLVKSFDTETKSTNLFWYPQSEITAESGVVTYQIAAYDTGTEKSVWYSKEGRLIVTQSIDTTDFSTELIGSSPNLITQILTLSKKLELNIDNSNADIQLNKENITRNASNIASLSDEFAMYRQSAPIGEETYNSQSTLAQSGKAVAQAIANIVNSAPETLDTLEELAKALGNDPNFATTIMTLLGGKVDTGIFNSSIGELQEDSVIHKSNMQNPHSVTKEQVGLGSVDNTSDMDKPVSKAVQAELDGKVNKVDAFGLIAVEPHCDSESDEDDPYTWDIVELTNIVYDAYENQTTDRAASVYSVEGADKKLADKVDKIEGKGLSSNDFTDDCKRTVEENSRMIGEISELNTNAADNLVDAINEIYDDIHQEPITTIPTTLSANNQYNFGEVATLNLIFPTVANDGDVIYLTFKSGTTATALTIDTTNTCDIEVIPEANTGYEIFGKYNGEVWIVNYSEYTVSEE